MGERAKLDIRTIILDGTLAPVDVLLDNEGGAGGVHPNRGQVS